MNKGEILDEVAERMHDPNNVFASRAQTGRWFNSVVKEIARFWNWPFLVKTAEVALPSAGSTVALPGDVRGIIDLSYDDSSARPVPMQWMPAHWIRRNYTGVNAGSPLYFTDGGFAQPVLTAPPVRQLLVAPAAREAYTLNLTYVMEPEDISDDSHYPPLPSSFDEAIIYGIMRKYVRAIEAGEMAQDYDAQFRAELEDLLSAFKDESRGRHGQIVLEWGR